MTDAEQTFFIRSITHAEIAASAKLEIDLSSIKKDFILNFNTLRLVNTSTTSAVKVYLDGIEVGYLTGNNGSFNLKSDEGLYWSNLALENTDAVNAIAANEIKIHAGRLKELV